MINNTQQMSTVTQVNIRKVANNAPFEWLSKGLNDLKTARIPSLVYGFVFALIGLGLILLAKSNPIWSAAFISAFMLIGPFIAIGLYELSRQIEEGEKPCLLDSIKAVKSNLLNLGMFVVVLGFILMLWLRVAALIAGVFFNDVELITQGWSVLFSGDRSIEFLIFFTIFGFFIAQIAFSISVVSIPMLLHRKVDVISAITTSLRVVIKNPIAMLIWAVLIVILINLGFLLAFIGLAVTLPIIGHASWHAYRDLVVAEE